MLLEKIVYQDDFPINITISNIKEYPIHYHQDVEFVFVLKGEVLLKNGYCTYTLREGDIFTNAGNEIHSIYSTGEENIVALIHIGTRYFSDYFPSLRHACYRTHTNKSKGEKYDLLNEKILNILLKYLIRSSDFKGECTYLMLDVISCLEESFNLFALDENVVVNFESGNQITIDRISHIIGYIYKYYPDKITLTDLSEMEHLSKFYLSHIIKNCTGMNFRDFLCFARVERSEVPLLDTEKKISEIARDVGFSTTAYYEKYFKKWFGRTPAEHRKLYKPMVMSDSCRKKLEFLPSGQAINLIKQMLSTLDSQNSGISLVNKIGIDVRVDTDWAVVGRMNYRLNVIVTLDDFMEMGYGIFAPLIDLRPSKVSLLVSERDSVQEVSRFKEILESALKMNDIEIVKRQIKYVTSAANYSNALSAYLLNDVEIAKDEYMDIPLRDKLVDGKRLFTPSALTAEGIKKPVYYVYQLLSIIKGDILCHERYYEVVRIKGKGNRNSSSSSKETYMVIASNYGDKILKLLKKDSTPHQTKTVINEFKDEADINISLNLPQGKYSVLKYSTGKSQDLFSYMAALDFNDYKEFLEIPSSSVSTAPNLEVYSEEVINCLNLSFVIRGLGIQLAFIKPQK